MRNCVALTAYTGNTRAWIQKRSASGNTVFTGSVLQCLWHVAIDSFG